MNFMQNLHLQLFNVVSTFMHVNFGVFFLGYCCEVEMIFSMGLFSISPWIWWLIQRDFLILFIEFKMSYNDVNLDNFWMSVNADQDS
jgi:hypothetical protein